MQRGSTSAASRISVFLWDHGDPVEYARARGDHSPGIMVREVSDKWSTDGRNWDRFSVDCVRWAGVPQSGPDDVDWMPPNPAPAPGPSPRFLIQLIDQPPVDQIYRLSAWLWRKQRRQRWQLLHSHMVYAYTLHKLWCTKIHMHKYICTMYCIYTTTWSPRGLDVCIYTYRCRERQTYLRVQFMYIDRWKTYIDVYLRTAHCRRSRRRTGNDLIGPI